MATVIAAGSEKSANHQLISKLQQLSQTGELYDCTIRASSPTSSTYKDFQCHKLILSLSSDMFKTMFSSNFKEAKMSSDEPILLQNVEPEVFACAMRYMYGHEKEIKDTSFGAEVYKLAHELQIISLIQELDIFFKGSQKASEVFAIFDLYLALDDSQETLNICRQTLRKETAAALASEQWLNISLQAVQEFLQMEPLFVEEVDLVKALIRWGKHQVEKDGDDPNDGQKLRSKIFPALKHIRFVGLTQDEFANLCLEELGAVLNVEERHTILMSLITKQWNLMLKEISSSEAATPRKSPYAVCELTYAVQTNCNFTNGPLMANIDFFLNKNAEFVGFKVNLNSNPIVYEYFTFQLLGAAKAVIGQGSSTDKITIGGEEFVKINPSSPLIARTNYSLIFTFPCPNLLGNAVYALFSLVSQQPAATLNGLTLSVAAAGSYVYVEKMLFIYQHN